MYNVKVDENMFFTGSYATVGSIKDGIDIDKLPPTENALCYKMIDVEVVVNQYDIPVMQYAMQTVSETEFDVYYFMETAVEETEEIQSELPEETEEEPTVDAESDTETQEPKTTLVEITEEEYNNLSEEEQSKVTITKVPKMVTVELTAEEFAALSEDEKTNVVASFKTDDDGNIVYETIYETAMAKDWEFSQEKYDELEAIRIQKEAEAEEAAAYQESISNETLKAENEALTEQVEMLTSCLLELSEILYA